MNRINKSTTKFLPKRKVPSSSSSHQRASSTTPSIAGTPKVTAFNASNLSNVEELNLEEEAREEGAEGESHSNNLNHSFSLMEESEDNNDFLAPLPHSKASTSNSKATPILPAPPSSFTPRDPSVSPQKSKQHQQHQHEKQQGERNSSPPLLPTPPATAQTSSSSTPSSSKGKGTAFGISSTGPPVSQPIAPPLAPPSLPPAAVAVNKKQSKKAKVPSLPPSEEVPREEEEDEKGEEMDEEEEEPRSQKVIESELAKQKVVEKTLQVRKEEEKEQRRLAKSKAKGKGKEIISDIIEGEEEEEEEQEEIVPSQKRIPKKKATLIEASDGMKGKGKANGKAKGKGKVKLVDDDEVAGSDEEGILVKKRKRASSLKKVPKNDVDRTLLGFDSIDDPDVGSNQEDTSDQDEDDGDGEGEEGEEGEGEEIVDSDRRRSKRKKSEKVPEKKKGQESIRMTVDPESTTMAELATPKDTLRGRTSKRGIQLAEQVARSNLMRRKSTKEKNRIMKERAERRRNGEISDPEDREGEEEDEEGEERSMKEESASNNSRLNSPAVAGPSGNRQQLHALDFLAAAAAELEAGELEVERAEREAEERGNRGEDEDEDDDDDAEGLVETQYAPQMRIVDGKMVIDDASLEVDRSKDARLGHVGPREVIEESAGDRMVNSASWRKKKRTATWTVEDTNYFYECIRQFGTDFEMIAGLFPGRERSEIKRKFNKEDKNGNEQRLTDALMQRTTIDLDLYAKLTGSDLSGPIPEDPLEAIRIRREATEKLEENIKVGTPNPMGEFNRDVDMDAIAEDAEEEEEEEEEEDEDEVAEAERRKQLAIDEALEKELEKENLKKGGGKKKNKK